MASEGGKQMTAPIAANLTAKGATMNQLKSNFCVAAVCFCVALLAGCGGGGGGGDSGGGAPPSNPATGLTGTWFGSMEDAALGMHTLRATISGTSITEVQLDNTITGQTGTITQSSQSAQIYSFSLNDGTTGGFFLDTAAAHAAFLDTDDSFGVLQKGATSLPTFTNADLAGSFSGIVVTVTANLSSFTTATSSATCTSTTTTSCSVTDSGGTTSASFQSTVNTTGRFLGSIPGGIVRAFLSADKAFGGTYSCPNGSSFPAGCEFTAWRKQ